MTPLRLVHFALCFAAMTGCLALHGSDDLASGQPEAASMVSSPAVAPEAPANDPLTAFGEFLDNHATIEARLREDAALLHDPAFLKNHPSAAEFVKQHPDISAELASQPRWFLHREFARRSTPPAASEQLAEFDRFLDANPEVEKSLSRNPALLGKPEFVRANTGLRDYLDRRPNFNRAPVVRPNRLPPRIGPVTPPKRPDVRKVAPKIR